MKRTALLVLLALGVGFAVGAARSKKFAFLSDRWNRVVRLTEIELACLRSCFDAREPVPLVRGQLVATEIRASVRPTHIHLAVQVKVPAGATGKPGPRDWEQACAEAYRYWRSSLLRRPIPDPSECPITIDLLLGPKTVYRQISDPKGRRGFENPHG